MNKVITKVMIGAGFSALLLSTSAMAEDGKHYIGTQCSFADNPLASHNRIHHLFRNTSGVSQWISCPVVRETNNNIEYASIDFNTTVANVRLEIRYDNAGTLAGWDYQGTTNHGSGIEYYWFNGSTTGAAAAGAALAIEAYLPNNAYVFKYQLSEV